jgi:hypothetical protein
MAISQAHHAQQGYAGRTRRKPRAFLWLPMAVFIAGVIGAGVLVTYILWPRWPAAITADAPSMPITVNGVNFNIPPAAIRNKVQRKPGTQDRVDLVFLWPSLLPPDATQRPEAPVMSAGPIERTSNRLFLTVASYGNTLPMNERFESIYPRYLASSIATDAGGLTVRPFETGSPYAGEDLLFDSAEQPRFIVRCSRDGKAGTIGICLYEKRAGAADITARFPRAWLGEWRDVQAGIEKLVGQMRGVQR